MSLHWETIRINNAKFPFVFQLLVYEKLYIAKFRIIFFVIVKHEVPLETPGVISVIIFRRMMLMMNGNDSWFLQASVLNELTFSYGSYWEIKFLAYSLMF